MTDSKPTTKTPKRKAVSTPRLYRALIDFLIEHKIQEEDPINLLIVAMKNAIVDEVTGDDDG